MTRFYWISILKVNDKVYSAVTVQGTEGFTNHVFKLFCVVSEVEFAFDRHYLGGGGDVGFFIPLP